MRHYYIAVLFCMCWNQHQRLIEEMSRQVVQYRQDRNAAKDAIPNPKNTNPNPNDGWGIFNR